MRRVYITGASGLLGSEIVAQLLEDNKVDQVVCLSRDTVPTSRFFSKGFSNQVTLVPGDLRDRALHARVLGEYEIDTVFHLAAQPLVQVANRNPFETMEVNIRGTYCLLEAVRTFKDQVKATVIASSDKAYGIMGENEYTEEQPLQGRFPYDVSKSCTDLLSQAYAHSYGLNLSITRCGNFFGPGDLNESRIIPTLINAFLRNERPEIRSDGTQVRDYIYVADGAAAYLLLAKYLHANKCQGEAFNFSYGLRLSVLEVIDRIKTLLGSNIEPKILNQAKNEIPFQALNSDKARKILGWKPQFGFDEGLKQTLAWHQQQFQRNHKKAA